MSPAAPADATPWYRAAVIYQLHVKTFCDSNGDGVGDFPGLISRLDYLQSLGVTCLWLLPFYASPLLDDGYDVADYLAVHPAYGTLDDVRRFLDEAHQRGLRVITELVINHTSDQHAWFQRARQAPRGTPERDFYVWSDTTAKFADARIIFRDTESSNWSWDAVAGQYYWHRFFHHQPDLNFDNPAVQQAVLDVMRYWLALGVDGLRLDAIAHLVERDGTSCDNLPETHAFIKSVRAALDATHPDCILLAEVNQQPDVTMAYFGDGDECHMAFHFPLMPRLFQALATQQAAPVIDVVTATRAIPSTCQWALFLRNHDELTLSALTTDERTMLLDAYAPAHRMRLNNGIRRRLAPLLGNRRERILLATLLTFSLPGSPIVYYGDEIGMGEDIALADRDGVRTPMQWDASTHGGFSRAADGVRLVLPMLDDSVYGYRRVNVAAEESDPASLLNAIRQCIARRQQLGVFGGASIGFLETGNPHVLAFTRGEGEPGNTHRAVLVVANLSRSEQAVTITTAPVDLAWQTVDVLRGLALQVTADGIAVTMPASGVGWWPAVLSAQQNGYTGQVVLTAALTAASVTSTLPSLDRCPD